MAASTTDKLLEVGGVGTATNLTVSYTSGATSITVDSTANWPTATAVVFAIDEAEIINGEEVQIAGTYNEYIGIVSTSTSITSVAWRIGPGDRNYTAGALTRVYVPVSAKRENLIVEWGLTHADQDGTLKAGAVDTSAVLADGIVTKAKLDTAAQLVSDSGWSLSKNNTTVPTPNTITYNGNRSYDLVFNSTDLTGYISPGMRLRTTRTVATPTGALTLNGTTQYAAKTTPNAMTFTDDFVVSAWIKATSYAAAYIVSRSNGTNGWGMYMRSDGRIAMLGLNGAGANFSEIVSNQSIPLNKWIHVTCQLDMSTFTNSSTTSYVMFDGLDVPATPGRGGTNPTALVQAGDLQIGAAAGASFFPGKIAQVAIYSAKVTQSTVKASITQTLSGSETNLISAYKLDQASGLNDLSANANNLTATGSPTYTVDQPFTQDANGTPNGTTDYSLVQAVAFSTNTTITVQCPEGCAIPTSGGVSAVAYSVQKAPYGFPNAGGKWELEMFVNTNNDQATPTATTAYNLKNLAINAPVGSYYCEGWLSGLLSLSVAGTFLSVTMGISTSSSTMPTTSKLTTRSSTYSVSASEVSFAGSTVREAISVTTQTPYYLLTSGNWSGGTVSLVRQQISKITLTPSNL